MRAVFKGSWWIWGRRCGVLCHGMSVAFTRLPYFVISISMIPIFPETLRVIEYSYSQRNCRTQKFCWILGDMSENDRLRTNTRSLQGSGVCFWGFVPWNVGGIHTISVLCDQYLHNPNFLWTLISTLNLLAKELWILKILLLNFWGYVWERLPAHKNAPSSRMHLN